MPRILRTPWTSQPQVPVGVDWSNLIAAKLSAVSVPVGGVLKNYSRLKVDDISYPSGTNINLSAGLSGIGAGSVSANTDAYRLHAVPNQTDTAWESIQSAGTWFALVVRYGNADGNAPIFANCAPNAAPYTAWGITDGSGVGDFVVECSAGNAYRSLTISSALTNNKPLFLVGRYNGSTLEAWINGVKQSGSTACSGTITYPSEALTRGPAIGNFYNYTSSNRAFIGRIFVAGISPTALSDAEIKSLSSNPWQIFMPANRPLYFDLGAGGGDLNITASLGTASATGYAATVDRQHTIAASLGAATAQGYGATVNRSRDIAASLGTATASGYGATVNRHRDIAASLGAATAQGYSATISFGSDLNIAASLGIVSADGYQANVNLQRDIAASLGTATAFGYQASISDTDPLYGFTQDQLDFLLAYINTNSSKLKFDALSGTVLYLM